MVLRQALLRVVGAVVGDGVVGFSARLGSAFGLAARVFCEPTVEWRRSTARRSAVRDLVGSAVIATRLRDDSTVRDVAGSAVIATHLRDDSPLGGLGLSERGQTPIG